MKIYSSVKWISVDSFLIYLFFANVYLTRAERCSWCRRCDRRRCRFLAGVKCGVSSRCVVCRWTYNHLPSKVSKRGWMQSASLHNAQIARATLLSRHVDTGKGRQRERQSKENKYIYIYVYFYTSSRLTITWWHNSWLLQTWRKDNYFSFLLCCQHCFHAFQFILYLIFDIVAQIRVPQFYNYWH